MKIYNVKLMLLMAIVVGTTACNTAKRSGKTKIDNDVEAVTKNQDETPIQAVYKMQKAQPAFSRAFVKRMSVNFDFKGRQLDVKATCKIVSDSAIHISIQPFMGIELFKLEATPSSIIVIDKTNKTYYESNYGLFNYNIGMVVDFEGIQSVLSNRIFIPGKKVILEDDFKWQNEMKKDVLELNNYTIREEITLERMLERVAALLLVTPDGLSEMCTNYADFKLFDGVMFPAAINISIENKKSRGAFNFKLEEVQFDKSFTMEPTNLNRYIRGDIRAFFNK